MKKCFLMAFVAVVLTAQFADAGVFSRWRARRESRMARPVAAARVRPRTTTLAPAKATPAPAPATPTTPPPAPAVN